MSWWKKLFGGASKSTLIQAAKDRNHALAKDLIAAGVDIDAADGFNDIDSQGAIR